MNKIGLLLRRTPYISKSLTSSAVRCQYVNQSNEAYRPRFRPRRLVMPADPNDIHRSDRDINPLARRAKASQRLKRSAERRGSIRLSVVPSERCVWDAFRLMMEACDRDGMGADLPLSSHYEVLRVQLDKHAASLSPALTTAQHDSLSASLDDLVHTSNGQPTFYPHSRHRVDELQALLSRMPLSSPANGMLALRGKAVVEGTLLRSLYSLYPRLRSKHCQQFLHECTGLLPCGLIARRIGFTQIANVDREVTMWMELNVLTARLESARVKAAQHRDIAERGGIHQRRWYWRGVLKSATGRLKMLPFHRRDIQPRVEWIRSQLFSFIAFVEMAEQAATGDTERTRHYVLNLFAPSLARSIAERCVLNRVTEVRDEPGIHSAALEEAYQKVLLSVEAPVNHPLNDAADRRRKQMETSGGAHSLESLRDDIEEALYRKFHLTAAPVVVHSTQVLNALKEVQLILQYSSLVSPALQNGKPLNIRQTIRRSVEVHETNPFASLRTGYQQHRQVEYQTCRLYSGRHCIGEGRGESVTEAIQMAAQQTVSNFYLNQKDSLHPANPPAEQQPLEDSRTPLVEETLLF